MSGNAVERALLTGTVASLTSSIALAVVGKAEGKAALQPVNATSHWLNGEAAASFESADGRHTAVGYATHHAATIFWAAIFETWLGSRPPRTAPRLLADAMVMSAVAAAVDYGPTPKRFTPGWEFVLSRRGMAVVYAAMGLGLAAGAALTAPRRIGQADTRGRNASPGRAAR